MFKKMTIASIMALSLLTAASTVMPASSVSANEAYAAHGSQIVKTAKSYMGKVIYKFGTRNPSKLMFDCSSFTQYVFKKNGISIPWGSQAQAKVGKRVSSKSKLAVGDLVMFSVGNPGKINHVGIYIGNGQFISNTKSGGVSINSMNKGYWGSRYITGRHY
ncbi:C40 family peptidase [Paenibacillus sp. JX-17]|uniref:C40 family peptidase n=1 Tax=Paenibacillus lacisoli TaxID=3064525 RepID=A0ABT9CDD7_9BACL|nr:C40 family peptidase [Paenibacillus sp. JX-17]MDO7905608.1 C40 family peptidase [Paenibacillus sp. JX-17]